MPMSKVMKSREEISGGSDMLHAAAFILWAQGETKNFESSLE